MLHTGTSSFRLLATMLLLVGSPATWAQQPLSAAAPVPTKIFEAKKVFISNAGVDVASAAVWQGTTTGPNEPYSQFYFAMQRWGRYELVGTPSDADLVLQLRLSAPLASCHTYQPQIALTILDSNTHFVLWTVTRQVGEAHLIESIASLLDELKRLATQPSVARR